MLKFVFIIIDIPFIHCKILVHFKELVGS